MAWKGQHGISSLCAVLGVAEGEYHYARSAKGCVYVETTIYDAKNGKPRDLCYPPKNSVLRKVQVSIKENILSELRLLHEVKGYRPKNHNINVASYVCGHPYLGKVDISKFHPSITTGHVAWALREHGLSPSWAREIARIATFNDRVPQGASTSNHIANLVMDSMLRREIKRLADSLGVRFVNFGDDVAFYGENPDAVRACVVFAKKTFRAFGFQTNDKCADSEHRGGRRKFIGCSTGRLAPDYPRVSYRELRSEIRGYIQAERMRCVPEPFTSAKQLNSLKHRIVYISRLNPLKARRLLEEFYRLCAVRRKKKAAC